MWLKTRLTIIIQFVSSRLAMSVNDWLEFKKWKSHLDTHQNGVGNCEGHATAKEREWEGERETVNC